MQNIKSIETILYVNDQQKSFDNASKSGAKLISPVENRDWGDKVCYFADLDGHIIAFAEKVNS